MANGQTNISGGKQLVGTAKPSDVRMGMTYPDGKELRSGTLDLRNLRAENIKSGVTIGGVSGALASLFEDNIEILSESEYYEHKKAYEEIYLFLYGYSGSSICVHTGDLKTSCVKEIGNGGSPICEVFKLINLRQNDVITIPSMEAIVKAVCDGDVGDDYTNKPEKNYTVEPTSRENDIYLIRNHESTKIGRIHQGGPGKVFWREAKWNDHTYWTPSSIQGDRAYIDDLNPKFIQISDYKNPLFRSIAIKRFRCVEEELFRLISKKNPFTFSTYIYDRMIIFFRIINN